jgi:hypothetical protein
VSRGTGIRKDGTDGGKVRNLPLEYFCHARLSELHGVNRGAYAPPVRMIKDR